MVVSLPAGAGFGLPTLYFAIQGLGVLLERSRAGRRLGLAPRISGRLFMLACTVLPLPWLFPAPFVRRVVVPFLAAIGAV
jgi:alginate O-acetyltransferase complex protein AlgI